LMSKNKAPGRLHHPLITLFDDNANNIIQNFAKKFNRGYQAPLG
jgi:hypothetical protein